MVAAAPIVETAVGAIASFEVCTFFSIYFVLRLVGRIGSLEMAELRSIAPRCIGVKMEMGRMERIAFVQIPSSIARAESRRIEDLLGVVGSPMPVAGAVDSPMMVAGVAGSPMLVASPIAGVFDPIAEAVDAPMLVFEVAGNQMLIVAGVVGNLMLAIDSPIAKH